MEGRSASQIAIQLGASLTRNAVIGKVHRLGLAGRVKANVSTVASCESDMEERETVAVRVAVGGSRRSAPRASVSISSPAPSFARAHSVNPHSMPLARAPAVRAVVALPEENVIPLSLRVTIVELRDNMCKWPLGDPSSAEFRYCGSPTHGTTPYCSHHGKVAYQPAQDRRRERDRRPLLAR